MGMLHEKKGIRKNVHEEYSLKKIKLLAFEAGRSTEAKNADVREKSLKARETF
ncbi:hypothetical protein CTRC69_00100 [Chlamydia trachomatis RC-F/69]|nr:hypothetical protein CTRC69_00100 [Chlamydia trachomatis RC-F/69]AGR97160.1 hypothetical protein CTRC953_00100 [Chlamydia trachomatis RC-J/953]AGR98080.1 hypothetical protein CTRC3_00100 [Chlamydia trachomatis RC-L2(s)/3]AGS00887.1 hypothetical protein CTRC966_00105 [Chlamydia trachomatis RC-J/966]AGS02769.1 hypothetical protein CTRC971_00105 [Chlamydia trachomatis RC-J/971]AGS03694.1 hypothetical protein CTRC55_00105 [Chlamydia trachomatis RC-L2/55]